MSAFFLLHSPRLNNQALLVCEESALLFGGMNSICMRLQCGVKSRSFDESSLRFIFCPSCRSLRMDTRTLHHFGWRETGSAAGSNQHFSFSFFSCGEKGQSMKEALKITLRLSSASMMEYAQKSFYAIGIKV